MAAESSEESIKILQRFPSTYYCNMKSLSMKLPHRLGWHLSGNSWSCDKTAFVIPELEFHLDAGYIPSQRHPSHIFLTHCHGDHSTDLIHLVSRHKPPNIFLPEEIVEPTRVWLESYLRFKLSLSSTTDLLRSYNLIGVQDGQKIPLPNNKSGMTIEAIRCHHSVPSFGYGLLEVRKKMKPEYLSLSGQEKQALRKQGVDLTYPQEIRHFAFLGDTTTQVYQTHPHIFEYPIIICECTFLTEDCRERAEAKKHTLWADLEPFVLAHPETVFVLIHFSHRHTPVEIRTFFDQKNLPNVIAWVPSSDIVEEDAGDPEYPYLDAE